MIILSLACWHACASTVQTDNVLKHKTYKGVKWRQEHTDSFLGLLDWRHDIIDEECLLIRSLSRKRGQREENCQPFRDSTTLQYVSSTMSTPANMKWSRQHSSTMTEMITISIISMLGVINSKITCNKGHVPGFDSHLPAWVSDWLWCHMPSSLSPQSLPVRRK